MFQKDGFALIHTGVAKSPRMFAYVSTTDSLEEILKPGYFNPQKILLLPNSFIKVLAPDGLADVVIKTNTGDVTLRDEYFCAMAKKASKTVMPKRTTGGRFIKSKKIKKRRGRPPLKKTG